MTNRAFFMVVAAVHLLATIVAWLWMGSWQLSLLESAGPERVIFAPTGLLIVGWIATLLALPIMLPLAYVAGQLGYVDPINDKIYWILPMLNSVAVGCIAFLVRRRYIKRRRLVHGR